MLSGLIKHAPKNDFCGALNWIPRTTRLMYVHAYQSMIWNNTVSRKIAEHGLRPCVGDLVAKQPGADKIESGDITVLTAETIGNYSVYDVVVPLVGHSIVWPENESKTWMEEVFSKGV